MLVDRLAYHAATRTLVLFGYYPGTSGSDSGRTWTFDGATWSARDSSGQPAARGSNALTRFDRGGVVLLFGGYRNLNPTGSVTDTWAWDGSKWMQLAPKMAPSSRFNLGYGTGMSYDPVRQLIVLFGGDGDPGGMQAGLSDTWTWDGVNWSRK
jgi:hypothetical protein